MFVSNASGAAQSNDLSVAFDLPTLVTRDLEHPRSRDAAMLTDNDLQRMDDLSHCLHPDHGIALSVTLEAYEPVSLIRRIIIWRVKRRLALQLEARFQSANIFQSDHHSLLTRPPTEHERGLVQHSLAMVAPWGAPHIPSPTPDKSILETYFDWPSAQSDWDRIHALMDPTCVGLPQLIREYNHHFPQGSDMRLDDPDRKLQIPCFTL
jgi:hypothetical protein